MTDRVDLQQAAIDDFLELLHDQCGLPRRPGWKPAPLRSRPLPPTRERWTGDRLPQRCGEGRAHRQPASRHRIAGFQTRHHDDLSFTTDTNGYVYDLSGIPDGVPLPEHLPEPDRTQNEVGPWDERWLGPSAVRSDGTREATHRHWFRVPRPLHDDPHLHTALLGYATDWTGLGGRPLHLEGDTTGMISLDHAAWFHRPARADDWLLQDVQSLVNAGGRAPCAV